MRQNSGLSLALGFQRTYNSKTMTQQARERIVIYYCYGCGLAEPAVEDAITCSVCKDPMESIGTLEEAAVDRERTYKEKQER